MGKKSWENNLVSFSSDTALANQASTTINLPPVSDGELFEDRLEQLLIDLSTITNTKEAGNYNIAEILTFKQYFITGNPQKRRNVYRKCFDLVNLNGGNIAASATVAFAHGISNLTDAVLIYVSCVTTDPEYFTMVYPDIHLDGTNINFTNSHASAVTSALAVCEYTKE